MVIIVIINHLKNDKNEVKVLNTNNRFVEISTLTLINHD